jgi:membrane protease YdiL (CAAX protease family)
VRHLAPGRASLVTAALFGLWHIGADAAHDEDARAVAGAAVGVGGEVPVMLGAIAVTFAAGLLSC